MTPPLLKIESLAKSYGNGANVVEVLRDVSLEMIQGDRLAVMGPSGSGKSTLLHIIGTLDRPTSGSIRIEGEDPFQLAEPDLARFRNGVIGFIFQDHHLLPQYTVMENVLLPVLAFQGDLRSAQTRAQALLERVGLSHRKDHRPAELSGGERQRAAVARALICSPQLLLCDEPTGSLDRTTAQNVAALLLDLQHEQNTTLIVVTHSLDLAAHFEKRLELNEGRLETS